MFLSVPSGSKLCLPVAANKISNGMELSCCSIRNEQFLMSLATQEYVETLRNQLKTHNDKFRNVQNRFLGLDFHV